MEVLGNLLSSAGGPVLAFQRPIHGAQVTVQVMQTLQSGMQGIAVTSILTEHPFIHRLLVPEAQLCRIHHGQQVSVAVHT